MARGFESNIDIYKDLENSINSNVSTNNFYFIQKLLPRHISAFKRNSEGKEKERDSYFENLKLANVWLKKMITMIESKDADALIIILADHGGFVGLDYSIQSRTKQVDSDIIRSIFSSALAVKWPDDSQIANRDINTSVNLFRVLFSYLSEDEMYLEHLQDDKSFLIIENGAPYGVYEAMDKDSDILFEKLIN